MFVNGMEDLDDFGTDKEEEDQRPRKKRVARVDSDTESEGREPMKAHSRPVSKTVAPQKPVSKRKRASDTSDRTPKRTRVIQSRSRGETDGGNDSLAGEKEGDAMDQDSQGEETLEVEHDLFCPSDEDSLIVIRWVMPFSRSSQ